MSQNSPRRFTSGGEGLQEQVVDRFAILEALFEFIGLRGQFRVTQRCIIIFKGDDAVCDVLQPFDGASFANTEDRGESKHREWSFNNCRLWMDNATSECMPHQVSIDNTGSLLGWQYTVLATNG